MVGRAMAIDLSKNHYVTSIDLDKNKLDALSNRPNISTAALDIADKNVLNNVIKHSDIVISAVPGQLGLTTLTQIINLKKDLVDISFMPEDPSYLHSVAKENNVTAVVDCGIAPGMPNYIIGYQNEKMRISKVEIMVGGLPGTRTFPFEYKAPFSPGDVIEEYTRPARFIENGTMVVKPALSEPEYIEVESVGTLEAFNTDGLRSLVHTMKHIPWIKEKTLRYPGHIQLIKALKAAGFFDKNPILINGSAVIPFDLTSHILFNAWKYDEEEPEFTVLRVSITGSESNHPKEIIYDLHEKYDPADKISSMARTTGFTATGTADMILNGVFNEKGVFPPEMIGKYPVCFEYIIGYLEARGIKFKSLERGV
jgi:saccharopine dehydrogenase-like NADP-dependent oxidoreductase